MRSRTYFIVAAIGFVLLFIFYYVTGEKNHPETTNEDVIEELPVLTFSNTQDWDEDLLVILSQDTYPAFTGVDFKLPDPPADYSEETSNELQQLHQYEALRTPEKVEEIRSEIVAYGSKFGSSTLKEITTGRPTTTKLVDFLLNTSARVILEQKQHFDRVRPSYLDTTLTIAIDVPGHPAYPSGHSTQANLIASTLSELDPKNTGEYFASAASIARNREIAGLHYPSDTVAGRLLADQLHTILKSDPAYQNLLTEARLEWSTSTMPVTNSTTATTTDDSGENSVY